MVQDPGHIQFINPVNGDQYEKVLSCNNISDHNLQTGYKDIVW